MKYLQKQLVLGQALHWLEQVGIQPQFVLQFSLAFLEHRTQLK